MYSLEAKEDKTEADQGKNTTQAWIVKNVQRLQAWSMLAYYPLEHACEYFRILNIAMDSY